MSTESPLKTIRHAIAVLQGRSTILTRLQTEDDYLDTILTAAERLAGERDALREYAKALEDRCNHLWGEMTDHDSCVDDPALGTLRRISGVTAAMMGEQE